MINTTYVKPRANIILDINPRDYLKTVIREFTNKPVETISISKAIVVLY